MIARTKPASGRDGFVLITVLSVLALLSGMVLAMLLLSRSAVETSSVAGSDLATETIAQSGVALAGYQLFVLKSPAAQVDGQQVRLKQGSVSISIASDAGKVDLNGAGKELLAAAFRASGLRSMPPESFAARVIDWRDPDDETSAGGAEAADYAAAGLTVGPRNGTFRSVDDLGAVDGISVADLQVVRAFITIDNPGGRLDAFSTPLLLLAALPGVTPAVADQIVSIRRIRTAPATAKIADLLLVQSSLIYADPPETYRVSLDIRVSGSARQKRIETVIVKGVDAESPYHVLRWWDVN